MKKQAARASLVACITDRKEDFYRLAYSYVKNQEDALDIVQESIKKALDSVDSVRNPDTIKSWFYKILVRTAIDFLRKQKKLKVMDDQTIEFLSQGKKIPTGIQISMRRLMSCRNPTIPLLFCGFSRISNWKR